VESKLLSVVIWRSNYWVVVCSLSERKKTKEQGSILRYSTGDWWGAGREGLGRSSWKKERGRAALWMGGSALDGC
jgi:hypothetical protein